MHRDGLLALLDRYEAYDEEERHALTRMRDFVTHTPACFERETKEGHITGSAWVVSPDLSRVFLMHHKKLNKWLQFGGHADGESDVFNVALNEAFEESGLENISFSTTEIFDVDIHHVAHGAEGPHDHYDVRFMFYANPDDVWEKNHESNALKWFTLDELACVDGLVWHDVSRMVEKTQKIAKLREAEQAS